MIEQADFQEALEDLAARVEDHESMDVVLGQLGVDVDGLVEEARQLILSQLPTLFGDEMRVCDVLAAGDGALRSFVWGAATGLLVARREADLERELDAALDTEARRI